jgi:hypothetical protein
MTDIKLESMLSQPTDFKIREVSSLSAFRNLAFAPPPLGPLVEFAGTFAGNGFNTIFRPQNPATPTPLPIPFPGSDNILELNLTSETLSFSKSLGSIPNRGMVQGDIFLNGVPYIQSINDVTIPSQPTGIHFEPGLWLAVPATTHPPVGTPTVARMASIPHGTTILAQGTSSTIAGKPVIPPVDITPFATLPPHGKIPFVSQTAANQNTPRIPQNLAPFIAAGTITQAMLTDPNTLLRNHIASQNIVATTIITVATIPALPLFGGGADNIAFLQGNAVTPPSAPNAQTVNMTATFWIETVEHVLHVPVVKLGHPPMLLRAETGEAGQPVPKFTLTPHIDVPVARQITVRTTQIQYTQTVFLNFNGLTWPHVSVATLVPSGPIPVPPSAWP